MNIVNPELEEYLHKITPTHHEILKEMETLAKITDFPIVLNTSFNINGEPIVLSPDDALNTFYNSGLRYLAIGDYLVEK